MTWIVARSLPFSCTFSIWKTGALSIEVGPEPGNCMKTFLVVELSTIAEISKSGVNSIAAIWKCAVRCTEACS